MKEKKKKKYSFWNNVKFYYQKLFAYAPNQKTLMILTVLGGIILPVFSIYIPKIMLDLVTAQVSFDRYAIFLGGVVSAYAIVTVLYTYMRRRGYMERNTYRKYLMYFIFKKSLRIPYAWTESEEMRGKYWESVYSTSGGDGSVSAVFYKELPEFVIVVGNFFIYSGIIGTLNFWIMAGLIVLAFCNFFLAKWEQKYREKIRWEKDRQKKRLQYMKNIVGGGAEGAKDIRIFHMEDWLCRRAEKLQDSIRAYEKKEQMRAWIRENIGYLLGFARDITVYGYLIYETVLGNITAGDFVLYLGAIMGFGNFVNQILDKIQTLSYVHNWGQTYREYNDMKEENVTEGTVSLADLKMPPEIEFSHVSFSYGKENVLKDLNFTINAGEKIAIVGENGAGKTTIVKLLCGLYEPTEGKIRINGIDIRQFAKKDLYRLFSAVFQDNRIFPFKVAENLTLQRQERVNQKRAKEALQKAELWETFEKNNISLDDYMTHYFLKDGVELSGGEQQKFMLARAIYKDAPILVLDEPTAALDPIAESDVYREYEKISMDKTSIFISHRLASTRFSNRIFFVKDGRITESGSHEELMKQHGNYARMFEVQSSYYRRKANERSSFL